MKENDILGKKYIKFHKNCVHKKYFYESEKIKLKTEFEKAQALKQVCDTNGITIAAPLKIYYKKSTIVYEKLIGYKNVKSHFINVLTGAVSIDEGIKLQFLAGRALGVIHKNLELPSKTIWKANETINKAVEKVDKRSLKSILSDTPDAYLHCDYGFANVAYRKINDNKFKIVLFDPSPNRYITTDANNFGSIYVDIGTYFTGLNGRIPLNSYKSSNWKFLPKLKNSFCEGYTLVTGNAVDQYKAEIMAYGFLSSLYTGAHIEKYKEDLTGVGLLSSLYDKPYIRRMTKNIKLKLIYNRFKGTEFWKK